MCYRCKVLCTHRQIKKVKVKLKGFLLYVPWVLHSDKRGFECGIKMPSLRTQDQKNMMNDPPPQYVQVYRRSRGKGSRTQQENNVISVIKEAPPLESGNQNVR